MLAWSTKNASSSADWNNTWEYLTIIPTNILGKCETVCSRSELQNDSREELQAQNFNLTNSFLAD